MQFLLLLLKKAIRRTPTMKYNRTYNFSAGPAMMPEPVLEEIRDEMMNYRGSGMCVMEMSHRSKVFQQIIDELPRLTCAT